MMGDKSSNRLLLAALFITGFATHARLIISSLLLIEIGETFGYPVGLAGQITSAASLVQLSFALIMGVLVLRYRPRTLLLTGMGFYAASAIACFLAPSFATMLVAYALGGVAAAMTFPMLGTIIGEALPPEERPKALGLITAGQPISFIIGTPIVNYIAGQTGWRMAFLAYMLPLVLVSFAVTYIGVPKIGGTRRDESRGNFEGFRGVLSRRTALSCLAATALFQASMWTTFNFSISFFRESYLLSTGWASLLLSAMALFSSVGSLTTGAVVKRLGRRRTTTLFALLLGAMGIAIYNSGMLAISIITVLPFAYLAGAGYVAGDSLTLEQVPEYRGTLMSLNTVARSTGATVGTMLGGALILLSGYGAFGLVMGVLGLASAFIYWSFTREPQ
jgi:predicted MFS family arabinose efflux permease